MSINNINDKNEDVQFILSMDRKLLSFNSAAEGYFNSDLEININNWIDKITRGNNNSDLETILNKINKSIQTKFKKAKRFCLF